jgi:hypothetical protein
MDVQGMTAKDQVLQRGTTTPGKVSCSIAHVSGSGQVNLLCHGGHGCDVCGCKRAGVAEENHHPRKVDSLCVLMTT